MGASEVMRTTFWEARLASNIAAAGAGGDDDDTAAVAVADGQLPEKPLADSSPDAKMSYIAAKYRAKLFLPTAYADATPEESNRELQSCVQVGDVLGACKWLCAGATLHRVRPANAIGPPLLHLAAQLGDLDMVSLLLAHGANPSSKDQGGTAADAVARQVGNFTAAAHIAQAQTEIVRAFQWHLTTAIPIPAVEEEKAGLEAARQSLSELPPAELKGMLRDVYDELQRRWLDKLWRSSGTDVNVAIPVPFLPIVFELPAVRQQSRQKLATLKEKRFTRLVHDLLEEVINRHMVHVDVAMAPPETNPGRKRGGVGGEEKRKTPRRKSKDKKSQLAAKDAVGTSGSAPEPGVTGLLHRVADALLQQSPSTSPTGNSAIAGEEPNVTNDDAAAAVGAGAPGASGGSAPTESELLQQGQARKANLEALSLELVDALESKVIDLEDEVRRLKRENLRLREQATDRELLIQDLRRNSEQHQPRRYHVDDPYSSLPSRSGDRRAQSNSAGAPLPPAGGEAGAKGTAAAISAAISAAKKAEKPKLTAVMESSTLALHGVFTATAEGNPDRISESVGAVIPAITKLCDRFVESSSRIKQGLAGRLLSKLEELLRLDPEFDKEDIEECAYEMAKAVKVLVSS